MTFERALESLQHSFVAIKLGPSGATVHFQHPSIRDILHEQLAENDSERQRYLEQLSIEGFIGVLNSLSGEDLTLDLPRSHSPVRTTRDLAVISNGFRKHLQSPISGSSMSSLASAIRSLVPKNPSLRVGLSDNSSPRLSFVKDIVEACLSTLDLLPQEALKHPSWISFLSAIRHCSTWLYPPPQCSNLHKFVEASVAWDLTHQLELYVLVQKMHPVLFDQLSLTPHFVNIAEMLMTKFEGVISGSTEWKSLESPIVRSEYEKFEEWYKEAESLSQVVEMARSLGVNIERQLCDELADILDMEAPELEDTYSFFEDDDEEPASIQIRQESLVTPESILAELVE